MASIRLKNGGVFVGNPIIVEVTAGQYIKDTSFLRMKVKVTAHLSSSSEERSFELSTPAIAGEPVDVDISSALRAVADTVEYDRTMTHYPQVKYKVETWEDYMRDGEHFSKTPVPLSGGERTALIGGFSDKERWIANSDDMQVTSFTTKPSTGEIVAQDETLMYPNAPVAYSGQTTTAYTFEGKSGAHTVAGKHQVYVVPSSPERYHFYFLNHLGIIETIAAQCYTEETKEYKSETHVVSRMETLSTFSRMMNRKTSQARIYKMSSGPLNSAWLNWWTDEFLATELAWVRIDGHYYPCCILPSESTIIRKNASDDVLEVTFSVRIQGL